MGPHLFAVWKLRKWLIWKNKMCQKSKNSVHNLSCALFPLLNVHLFNKWLSFDCSILLIHMIEDVLLFLCGFGHDWLFYKRKSSIFHLTTWSYFSLHLPFQSPVAYFLSLVSCMIMCFTFESRIHHYWTLALSTFRLTNNIFSFWKFSNNCNLIVIISCTLIAW